MKQKIPYEEFLFSSFIHSDFLKFSLNKLIMGNKEAINIKEFFNQYKFSSFNLARATNISELLFSIIWLKEEDSKLSNIKPSSLGIIDRYGCNNELDFLRHLRNSIAHKRCEFFDDGTAIFKDFDYKTKSENFYVDLTSFQIQLLIEEFRYIAINEFYPKTIKNHGVFEVYMGSNISLGDYAFCGSMDLDNITIPLHITEIPRWAFCNCKNLESIILSQNITLIQKRAFSGCEKMSLFSFNINTLNRIDDYALADCVSIKAINLSAQTFVGRRVFSGWQANQTINVIGTTTKPKNWSDDWNANCKAKINFLT